MERTASRPRTRRGPRTSASASRRPGAGSRAPAPRALVAAAVASARVHLLRARRSSGCSSPLRTFAVVFDGGTSVRAALANLSRRSPTARASLARPQVALGADRRDRHLVDVVPLEQRGLPPGRSMFACLGHRGLPAGRVPGWQEVAFHLVQHTTITQTPRQPRAPPLPHVRAAFLGLLALPFVPIASSPPTRRWPSSRRTSSAST